jgi:hypothetical protein
MQESQKIMENREERRIPATGMRRFRMQGTPPILSGSIVIRRNALYASALDAFASNRSSQDYIARKGGGNTAVPVSPISIASCRLATPAGGLIAGARSGAESGSLAATRAGRPWGGVAGIIGTCRGQAGEGRWSGIRWLRGGFGQGYVLYFPILML